MTKEELEQIRAVLLKWKREIMESQESAVKQIAQEGEEQTFPDPSDRASYEEDRITLFKLKDRESKLLVKIEQTLESIKSGEYGICHECGEDIPFERLVARPVTDLCIECKTAQEEKEKK